VREKFDVTDESIGTGREELFVILAVPCISYLRDIKSSTRFGHVKLDKDKKLYNNNSANSFPAFHADIT